MEKATEKICPLLYCGWLSFKGESTQADYDEVKCLGDQCAWFDSEKDQCLLVSKKE